MPRKRREISSSGIYHLVVRGVNRCRIFEDTLDYHVFLKRLKLQMEKEKIQLFAYCLMNNHAHLLIKEDLQTRNLARFTARFLSAYAHFFNKRHGRCGHLFQDRFKSKVVEDASYFMDAMVYIHNNPVVAGFVRHGQRYHWSSHSEHVLYQSQGLTPQISSPQAIPDLLDIPKSQYHALFELRHKIDDTQLGALMATSLDDDAFAQIIDHADVNRPERINDLDTLTRDQHIAHFLQNGMTCKQIARLTCIGEKYIYRLKAKKEEGS